MAAKLMRPLLAALFLTFGLCAAALAAQEQAPAVPVPGAVTLADFGASYCPPCRLMEPVLKDAAREYRGRAAVVVVDVTRYEALARKLGIRVIPTQIFYDKNGQEISRHTGYMDKKALAAELDKLLSK